MRFPLPKLIAATAAACALAPAVAGAATMSYENGSLVYRGEGSEGNSLLVSSRPADYTDPNGQQMLSFYDSGADRMAVTSGPCSVSTNDAQIILCPIANTPVVVEGSEARDTISIFSKSDVPDSIPFTIRGNGGDDSLKDAYDGSAGRTFEGGAGNDELLGYGGNDKIDGGDGNDTVDGGEGNDEVHGGAGDDVMWGDHYKAAGADVLDGGPGTDQVDEWTNPGGDIHPLPSVTLDGVANDGRPGEGDNVTNIEKFTFHVNATFAGTDAAETVEVLNTDEGASNLSGGGGNDVLKGYDLNDTIDGGSGDDRLEGGLGNDTITGGPGKDMIMGDSSSSYCSYFGSCKVPFGNDTINAVDGEADQVDCGIGDDVANVDAIDTTTNCETVNKGATAPAAGAPANGTPAGTTATTGGGASSGSLTIVGGAKLKALLAGKLSVSLPCATACRVSLTAKGGGRTVATGSTTLLKGGTATVKLKVSSKARKSLRKSRKLKLTVAATVTAADGAKTRVSRAVTLK